MFCNSPASAKSQLQSLIIFLLFFGAILPQKLPANSNAILLTGDLRKTLINSFCEYYIDTSQRMNFTDIQKETDFKPFFDANNVIYNDTGTLWLKFTLEKDSDSSDVYILENQKGNYLSLYIPNQDNTGWVKKNSGDAIPPKYHEIYSVNPTFVLETRSLPKITTAYLQFSSNPRDIVLLSIMEKNVYIQRSLLKTVWYSAILGITLMLMVYYIYLFFLMKDKSILVFVVFILCNSLFILSHVTRFLPLIFTPSLPYYAPSSIIIGSLILLTNLILINLLIDAPIILPTNLPVLICLIVSCLVTIVICILEEYLKARLLLNIISLLGGSYIFALLFMSIRNGMRFLGYVVTGEILGFLGVIVERLSFFPILSHYTWTESISAILFVLGLFFIGAAYLKRLNAARYYREKHFERLKSIIEYRILSEYDLIPKRKKP